MTGSALSAGMPNAADIYRQGTAAAMPNISKTMSKDELTQAAQDFEGFFLSQMLQPMFKGLEADPLFGGGQGEQAWKSMLIDEYAKEIAASGGVGIADQVMKAMLQAQEASQ